MTDTATGPSATIRTARLRASKAGATATDKFSYTVKDGSNAASTATVTVTITGQNDPPVAADLAASALEHGPATR